MKNRKSFLLHIDSLKILEKMTNEQAGIFIKKIYEFQKTGTIAELDFAMEMAITPFLNQFERDHEKWKIKAEANRSNGSKGGRPKKEAETQESQDEPKKPSGLFENPIEAKKGVNVNVSVNGNVNDNSYPNTKYQNLKTPTPTIRKNGVEKIGDLVGGVGKKLKIIDITGQLSGLDIQEIQRVAPGWDIEHLAKVYVDGINSGAREAPNSIPKAFPKWCEKYTKGKRP